MLSKKVWQQQPQTRQLTQQEMTENSWKQQGEVQRPGGGGGLVPSVLPGFLCCCLSFSCRWHCLLSFCCWPHALTRVNTRGPGQRRGARAEPQKTWQQQPTIAETRKLTQQQIDIKMLTTAKRQQNRGNSRGVTMCYMCVIMWYPCVIMCYPCVIMCYHTFYPHFACVVFCGCWHFAGVVILLLLSFLVSILLLLLFYCCCHFVLVVIHFVLSFAVVVILLLLMFAGVFICCCRRLLLLFAMLLGHSRWIKAVAHCLNDGNRSKH